MHSIRLIALDLDGTLLNAQKQISERNLCALRKAAAQGVAIVVASGRRYTDVMEYSERILKGQPVICANGAMACLNDPYTCVYCECLQKAQLRKVVEVLEHEKCYYHVYCDDGSVMESRTANPGLVRKIECYDYRGEVLTGDEMPKYVGDGALKVVCFSDDPDKLGRIRPAMEKIGGIEVNSSWANNLEMLAGGVHKGAALRALAERLSLPMEAVMAFGDNENDIPMFQAAGLPVAMGNATEGAKKAAGRVTLSNEEDGVAVAIEQLVLGEE